MPLTAAYYFTTFTTARRRRSSAGKLHHLGSHQVALGALSCELAKAAFQEIRCRTSHFAQYPIGILNARKIHLGIDRKLQVGFG
jgi:hypothetical protein